MQSQNHGCLRLLVQLLGGVEESVIVNEDVGLMQFEHSISQMLGVDCVVREQHEAEVHVGEDDRDENDAGQKG